MDVLIACPKEEPTPVNFTQHFVEVWQSILTAIPDLLVLEDDCP